MKVLNKLFILIFLIMLIFPIYIYATNYEAKNNTVKVKNSEKLFDYANLLSETEKENLKSKINNYIDSENLDLVVVTINKNNKSSATAYADDFYDYNDYGVGYEKSGLLFLIDMQNREMCISTKGIAIKVYTDRIIDDILDTCYVEENYSRSIEKFIDSAERYANEYYGNDSVGNRVIKSFGISAVISIIATAIYIGIGVAGHKNAKIKTTAREYAKLNLTYNTDTYLDKHVSQQRIERASSYSGGSSTHRSSSGSIHGGGSRKF